MIAKRLLFFALIGLAGIALLELAVRRFRPQPAFYARPGLYAADPYLGHRMRPGLSSEVGNFAEFKTRVHIDRAGLRGPEIGRRRPGVLRVLVLGDSFTFGTGVEDGETYPALLADALSRAGAPAEGLNAGIGGYGLPDEVAWYEHYGRALQPDLVVLGIFTGNDLQDAAPGRPALRVVDGEILDRTDRQRSSLSHWLFHHSQLFVLLKYSLPAPIDRLLRRTFHLPEPGAMRGLRDEMTLYERKNQRLAEAGGAASEAALLHLLELCRQDHARVAALLLPSDLEANERDWQRALRTLRLSPGQVDRALPSRIFGALFARHGVPVRDLAPDFSATLRQGEVLFFPHDRHYTKAGHRLIAARSAAFLRDRLVGL